MAERFISIDQAQTDQLRFMLPLPDYLDRRRFGVNVPRIQKLCKAGAINALAVVGSTDGDTSSYSTEIAGITGKGEAMAGKTAVQKIEPLQHAGVGHLGLEPSLPTYMLTFAMVDINLNEAVDRAIKESKGEKSIREIDTWTTYMDKALKKGIAQVGVHNLVGHGHKRFALNVGAAAAASLIAASLGSSHAQELFPTYLLFFNQIDNLTEFLHGRRYGLEGYRWSLFHRVQLDRAALFSIQARRGTLIKALPEPKEV